MNTTFLYRWIGPLCLPRCVCGWEGKPMMTLMAARFAHREHVNEECPIGKR